VGKVQTRDHLEDPSVDKGMILKWIFEKWTRWMEGMEWIDLAQNTNMWRAVVNAVMKFRDA
jgi:hypothetical protein